VLPRVGSAGQGHTGVGQGRPLLPCAACVRLGQSTVGGLLDQGHRGDPVWRARLIATVDTTDAATTPPTTTAIRAAQAMATARAQRDMCAATTTATAAARADVRTVRCLAPRAACVQQGRTLQALGPLHALPVRPGPTGAGRERPCAVFVRREGTGAGQAPQRRACAGFVRQDHTRWRQRPRDAVSVRPVRIGAVLVRR